MIKYARIAKNVIVGSALAVTLLLKAFAVENLTIHPNGSDVVLSWPSSPGQTFVILFATNLNSPINWQVLASDYPAAVGATQTTFVHGQIYPPAPVGSNGGGGPGGPPTPMSLKQAPSTQLMVLQSNQTLVPIQLFPPCVDLSGFQIYDSVSQSFFEGSTLSQLSPFSFASSVSSSTSDTATPEPACGFYQVLGAGITGGVTSGSTLSNFLTVTAKAEASVQYLRVLIDGQGIPGQSAIFPPFTGAITFQNLDTARVKNGGPYNLQVEAVYEIGSETGGGILHCLSQPIQVNVFNELSFPDWDEMTEDEVCNFDIESAHQSVDWEIDVYNLTDYYNWYYGYVDDISPIHVATGSSSDGHIRHDWNLKDDSGNARTNINNDPYFISFTRTWWPSSASPLKANTLAASSSGHAYTGNPRKKQPAKWPDQGHWVVAWQDAFLHFYDETNYFRNSFNWILGMANLPGTPVFWQPPVGGTNAQTFPIRYYYKGFREDLNPPDESYFQSTANDEDLLRRMLLDNRARNFFYSGHGSPEWIASLTLAGLLRDYGMHRYRFVWLDGCETANGSWPATFGINGPGVFGIEYYKERTKRPALFVGNLYEIPAGVSKDNYSVNGKKYSGYIPRIYGEFYRQFVFFWQTVGESYKDSVTDAQNLVNSAYPDSDFLYVSGPKEGQPYVPGYDQQRIGYEDLKHNEYNTKNDIPRP